MGAFRKPLACRAALLAVLLCSACASVPRLGERPGLREAAPLTEGLDLPAVAADQLWPDSSWWQSYGDAQLTAADRRGARLLPHPRRGGGAGAPGRGDRAAGRSAAQAERRCERSGRRHPGLREYRHSGRDPARRLERRRLAVPRPQLRSRSVGQEPRDAARRHVRRRRGAGGRGGGAARFVDRNRLDLCGAGPASCGEGRRRDRPADPHRQRAPHPGAPDRGARERRRFGPSRGRALAPPRPTSPRSTSRSSSSATRSRPCSAPARPAASRSGFPTRRGCAASACPRISESRWSAAGRTSSRPGCAPKPWARGSRRRRPISTRTSASPL